MPKAGPQTVYTPSSREHRNANSANLANTQTRTRQTTLPPEKKPKPKTLLCFLLPVVFSFSMDTEKHFILLSNFKRPSRAVLVLILTIIAVTVIQISTTTKPWVIFRKPENTTTTTSSRSCCGFYKKGMARKVVVSIKDFGGVGDGKSSNTLAFRKAIQSLKRFGDKGGSQLNVPKGRWVTGSFNLTSNFTLFLEFGAVLLGSQVLLLLFLFFQIIFSFLGL